MVVRGRLDLGTLDWGGWESSKSSGDDVGLLPAWGLAQAVSLPDEPGVVGIECAASIGQLGGW